MTLVPWNIRRVTARLFLTTAVLAGVAHLATAEPPPPALALGQLKAGNDRFVKNAPQPVAAGAPARQRAQTSSPVAMVLSCADARVPPELVFDTALGELFVVRSLGGVADRAVVASLEHGATALQAPVLVVMGHEACDIVHDAVGGGEPAGANRQYLVNAIRAGTGRHAAEQADVRAAVLANVEQVINDVMAGSEPLRQAAGSGRLLVVGAYYEMGSGRVVFSEPVTATPAGTAHR
ncbi:MAG: carbonic anhydrase [Vicinamibacterales bacterium]